MGAIGRGLGRLALVAGAGLVLYLAFVAANLAVHAVTASRSNPDAANREAAGQLFEQGKPYFDAMEYRIISDITALTDAVMSGAVNFSNEIPPKDWATVSSNPDLTKRFAKGLALMPDDKATWYTGGATGYADYPAAE